MTEEPISQENNQNTSDKVESPDLTIRDVDEISESQETQAPEPESASNNDVQEESDNSEETNDASEDTPDSETEKQQEASVDKVALMVPSKPKNQADASQSNSTEVNPGRQAQNRPEQQRVGTYKTASDNRLDAEPKQRSLPVPLQALKPKQKPLWIKAMRQPWFKRIQEKTIFQNISRSPKIHPNSLLIAGLAALVIGLQGYLNLSLPNLTIDTVNNILSQFNVPETQWYTSIPITYNFQLPLALLAGAVLGGILGGFTVLLFIAIGLFSTPIFANGGGIDYIYQPGFPFLAAMFVGTIFSGYFTKVAFSPKRTAKQGLYLYGGGIMSTLITHGIALIGLTVLLIITSPFLAPAHPISSWWQWVLHLSLEPLPYDLMATCLFLWFTRYIRLSVYPALY